MESGKKVQKLSLDEFKTKKGIVPEQMESILSQINGGSFMQCHTQIYEQTGIWIPELVPVFEKLDAALVSTKELPSELNR